MAVASSARQVWYLLSSAAPRPALRRNFYWTFSGNLVAAAAQWALIVLLARLGNPAMVGQYTLGLAITSPLFILTGLNLRALQATDVKGQFRFSDYLGIRLMSLAVGVAVTLLIMAAGSLSTEISLVVLLLAAQKVVDGISETMYGHWHQRERMDCIAQSMMLRGGASILVLSAAIWWTRSTVWGVGSLVAVSLAVLAGYDLVRLDAARRLRLPAFGSAWKNLWALARIAGPLGIAPMLVTLNTYQSRYWLAHHLSEADVGVYSALAYVTVAANLVVVALAQAAGPAMTRALDDGDRLEFLTGALRLAAVGGALGAAGLMIAWLWGAPLMALCYGPAYAGYSGTLLWLMLGGAFSYLASCTGYTLTAARRFLVQVPILCTVAMVIALASWLLVPGYGIRGAAMAQAIGSGVQLVLNVAMVGVLFRGLQRA